MKKRILKALSAALSTAMVSTVFVTVPAAKAADMPTPVVSYNFESDPVGLTLAGEAKVETVDGNGVLHLATKATYQETYAKFANNTFSNADFSNGLTITAKIYPTAYLSDWTPIFMFGSGALSQDGPGDASLQLTLGFSSRISSNSLFDGYFGNAIASPYSWDYFATSGNREKWYTLTMTVDSGVMYTYIDGVQVQTADAGNQDSAAVFGEFLGKFNTMTGNYLGASYWTADSDFQGYLDNVAVYNTALTATQVASLDTAFANDVVPPEETVTPDDAAPAETPDDTTATDTDVTPDDTDAEEPDDTTASDTVVTPDDTDAEEPDDTPADDTTTTTPADDTTTAATTKKKTVKLNKTKATVKVGKSVTLKVKNTTKKVTWSTSNKKVAKVKNGKVTGVKAGKATITAKVGKKTYKCKVTVK